MQKCDCGGTIREIGSNFDGYIDIELSCVMCDKIFAEC